MSHTTELQPCKPRCRHATCELLKAWWHSVNQAGRRIVAEVLKQQRQHRGAAIHRAECADGTGSYDENLRYNDGGDGA